MNLLSYAFILFVSCCSIIFCCLPKSKRPLFLLLSSFVYYSYFSVPLLLLIVASSSADYVASQYIFKTNNATARKLALIAAISWNALILTVFKYGNWLIEMQSSLLGSIGIHLPLPSHLNLLLPLGISFYTFEAISYIVDVYRGEAPAKNWWQYNLYIMWFPHLVSGPIVRFKALRSQFESGIDLPGIDKVKEAFELILFGCMLKLIVADSAARMADPVFQQPGMFSAPAVVGAMLAFTAQLYFDFWGYTQLCRGISLLFNITLPVNFNHPGSAQNISKFWTKWHMSLSQWMHDYVFVSVGGRSRALKRVIPALIITMMLVGLWHGAGMTYVIFGAYISAVVVVYHIYRRHRHRLLGSQEKALISSPIYNTCSWVLTQGLVVFGMAILRCHNSATLTEMVSGLARFNQYQRSSLEHNQLLLCGLLFFCAYAFSEAMSRLGKVGLLRAPYFIKVQAYAYAVALCLLFASETPKPFVYFKY